ncbi:hypothetical protein [Liquorilactobacillus uvarum]|uniref:hypothetical protein n=1 Tax=Liquorilactobacillus uvarum TaxID=303240 RepID=UPI00288C17EF|nr:hypothetical protein [Liquorilactobacillus uvarum]
MTVLNHKKYRITDHGFERLRERFGVHRNKAYGWLDWVLYNADYESTSPNGAEIYKYHEIVVVLNPLSHTLVTAYQDETADRACEVLAQYFPFQTDEIKSIIMYSTALGPDWKNDWSVLTAAGKEREIVETTKKINKILSNKDKGEKGLSYSWAEIAHEAAKKSITDNAPQKKNDR